MRSRNRVRVNWNMRLTCTERHRLNRKSVQDSLTQVMDADTPRQEVKRSSRYMVTCFQRTEYAKGKSLTSEWANLAETTAPPRDPGVYLQAGGPPAPGPGKECTSALCCPSPGPTSPISSREKDQTALDSGTIYSIPGDCEGHGKRKKKKRTGKLSQAKGGWGVTR